MKDKSIYRKRIRLMLIMSPFIFGLSIWCGLGLLQWAGLDLSVTEKYVSITIALIICCAAMYQGIKKHFLGKIREILRVS